MKNCKFCDKDGTAWVYPLIYSVVTSGEDKALTALPELGGTLGQGVTDLKLSERARYAVRRPRPGYIYVLIERLKHRYWRSYLVLEDSFVYEFPADRPPVDPVEFNCSRESCGIGASVIGIDKVSTVDNVWMMFSPTALSPGKLVEYRDHAPAYAAEGKLHHFDAQGWLNGNTQQPHTLKPERLMTTAVEFILFRQHAQASASPLGQTMVEQLYPVPSDAYAGTPPQADGTENGFLGLLAQKLAKQQAAVVVMADDIGITQTLNNFRNAALAPVETFLERRVGEVDNQRRLDVMQALDDVRSGLTQHFMALDIELVHNVDESNLPDHQVSTAKSLRMMGRIAEAQKVEADIVEHQRRKAANRQRLVGGTEAEERWNRTYAKLLDEEEIKTFRSTLERLTRRCGDQANARAADHLLWVKSDRLVNAFDIFDPKEPGCGFEFTHEHLLCTHGMFGIESNQATLTQWMDVDKVERKNLYMRANLFDDQDVIAQAKLHWTELRQAARSSGGVSLIPPDKLAKLGKGFVDAMKKSDSAWDEWLRDEVVKDIQTTAPNEKPKKLEKEAEKLKTDAERKKYRYKMGKLSGFHSGKEGLRLARMAEWTRAVSMRTTKVDHAVAYVVGALLYPHLGRLTEKIGMEEFFLKLQKDNLASIQSLTERAVAEGRMTPEQGQRHIENSSKDKAVADAARREGAAQARAAGRADRLKVTGGPDGKPMGSMDVVLEHERQVMRDRVHRSQEELYQGKRPPTNNFRQVRMGLAMMSLEGLALGLKVHEHQGELSERYVWEVWAARLSLASMGFDLIYASAKSMREIEVLKAVKSLNKAADILRGGLKITAGTLSTIAGGISAYLDGQQLRGEFSKKNRDWFLMTIYTTKIWIGSTNAALGFIAAFSYTGPMLKYVANTRWANGLRLASALGRAGAFAEGVALTRTLWLIRVARFNLIGLGITVVELGYTTFIKDDELQKWCKASTFRKNKSHGFFAATPYLDTKREQEALEKAFRVVTNQQEIEPQPQLKNPQAAKALPAAQSANAPN